MGASNRRDETGESISRTTGGGTPTEEAKRGGGPEAVGSWEHLQAAFARAPTVADRGVGLWLSRDDEGSIVRDPSAGNADGPDNAERPGNELSVHRALARAAATAYARRLKAEGLAPEQMLVLVKAASSIHGLLGFGAQALTSDIVRWSIDAYFRSRVAARSGPP
jgi:hypothetical protein